ncbi:glutathione S-transferase family protein [Phyllobacterium salinisoli]|uniref:Glutathione S-transferase family protein n=1 Tax=Phyllobacterium salinisoli TaxID=1899321 RepID=A0A368K4U2_9HYPH|nr:glutathione S-transferase family protein [Phyllobacterium salinisoli]RCS24408.1 glutathione S-transferase family protein [Phyllobacterium salinisoli]
MKLYSRPLSPYSSIIRGIIYAKNLPVKLIAPPPGVPIPEEFRAISPTKRIPVLITGSGETLFEASVIAEYLEEHFPETPLLPADPKDRARVRIIARIAELEILAPATELFILHSVKERNDTAIAAELRKLRQGLSIVEERLSDGPFAYGRAMSFADAWLTPIRFILDPLRKMTGLNDLLDAYPKFDAYAHKAVQHPPLSRVWDEMSDGLKVFQPSLA